MNTEIYSVGHSTHSIETFLELLKQHSIQLLADIRRFPGSRKFPQFNQDNLAASLKGEGIDYEWFEVLGGRRSKSKNGPSRNPGLRNESFRNYADYMLTDEFQAGATQLMTEAASRQTAIMCSESVYWRCHRRLVSDYLTTRGITVQHIMPTGELRPHLLTDSAKVERGELIYPAPQTDQTRLLFD